MTPIQSRTYRHICSSDLAPAEDRRDDRIMLGLVIGAAVLIAIVGIAAWFASGGGNPFSRDTGPDEDPPFGTLGGN